jgi:drug/metabolite transporter (DMT)-like permease
MLILFGAVIIGLMPVSAKFAYLDGANALLVMLARSVIGVVALGGYIFLRGGSTRITLANLRRSFVSGIAHVFAAIGILASIVYIDISLANIILFLFPFPIAVIAHFRGDTPLHRRRSY